MKVLALVLNYIILLLLLATIAGFIQLMNPFGFFMALVTFAIGIAVWKQSRWGYFALAALGLACYQLAKQDLAFIEIKRQVMVLGFFIIPVAVFLHEILARKPKIDTSDEPQNPG